MALTLSQAQQLRRDLGDTLDDPTAPVSPFTLRLWIKQFTDALKGANAGDAAVLHNIVGLAWTRLGKPEEALRAYHYCPGSSGTARGGPSSSLAALDALIGGSCIAGCS